LWDGAHAISPRHVSEPVLAGIAGDDISIAGLFSMHPLTVMMITGIAIQGLAECFISLDF